MLHRPLMSTTLPTIKPHMMSATIVARQAMDAHASASTPAPARANPCLGC